MPAQAEGFLVLGQLGILVAHRHVLKTPPYDTGVVARPVQRGHLPGSHRSVL